MAFTGAAVICVGTIRVTAALIQVCDSLPIAAQIVTTMHVIAFAVTRPWQGRILKLRTSRLNNRHGDAAYVLMQPTCCCSLRAGADERRADLLFRHFAERLGAKPA